MSGLVTFRVGERRYATALAAVREVVRLHGLTDLPGMAPPLAGVVDLRGKALPVLDLRPVPGVRGDVLVLEAGDAEAGVGVAVDAVTAVLGDGDLTPAGGPGELPGYVLQVLRDDAGQVFLVDLGRMVDAARTAAASFAPSPASAVAPALAPAPAAPAPAQGPVLASTVPA